MKAAIYARVSTDDQNNEIQLEELTSYANARGWTIAEVHQEKLSGAKAVRAELKAVMESAKARRIDVVLVSKIDRFGRSIIDLLNNIRDLDSAGVRFIAITQGIDTDQSNPASRLLLHMLAAIAEFERAMIRERTGMGRIRYRREFDAGRANSRSGKNLAPHRPKKILNRQAVIDLRGQGFSLGEIAQQLGLPRTSVHRIVKESVA